MFNQTEKKDMIHHIPTQQQSINNQPLPPSTSTNAGHFSHKVDACDVGNSVIETNIGDVVVVFASHSRTQTIFRMNVLSKTRDCVGWWGCSPDVSRHGECEKSGNHHPFWETTEWWMMRWTTQLKKWRNVQNSSFHTTRKRGRENMRGRSSKPHDWSNNNNNNQEGQNTNTWERIHQESIQEWNDESCSITHKAQRERTKQ